MRTTLPLVFAAALALSACQKSEPTAPETPVATASLEGWTTYGAPSADTTTVLPAEDVAAAPEEYTGRTIQIYGTVHQVCQAAGCWATLQTPTGTVRVAMPKDSAGAYVFTLPKDISGRRIIAEGTFDETTISADHARHMSEDAATQAAEHAEMEAKGDHEHADTSSATVPELRLTATGVFVKNG
ncbi:MAG: DUF4920 domain-containing protein [Rhodothermales bacterium]|nr:DUF4920 domain-containing protein [Rhodothermales bacterium]MCA0270015.1 DUF4920 domain-containing protein [Bacteroidota bacterium]